MKQTRRTFLRHSAAISAGTALFSGMPAILPARHTGVLPSEQLNVALIGCRGRGFNVLEQFLKLGGVNCVGLCDVDDNVLREKTTALQEKYGQHATQTHTDFRRIVEDKAVDAVIIGTPDHWHCLPMVYACEAGKDVYVEKPMANTIEECNVMVRAAQRYNRIVQVGQQQRSGKEWIDAMAYLKSGKLGTIRKADIWGNFNYGTGPVKQPDSPVPAGVDYDLWLGPAPQRPFNQARFHGSWRFFWDYGGGLMTDWGVHLIDMALWARDITSPPKTVLAYGAQLADPSRARETYDTMSVVFPYDDYLISWEHNAGIQRGPYDRNYGIAFLGDNGTLVADRNGWEVFPEWDAEQKADKIDRVELQKGQPDHDLHVRNFVECIRSRQQPACTAETGRTVAVCTHMANIAVRTGTYKLDWDEESNKFTNSRTATQLIRPEYRKPWKLPV